MKTNANKAATQTATGASAPNARNARGGTPSRWGATKAWLARFVAGQIVPVTETKAKNRVYAAAVSLAMRVAAHPQGLVVIWDGKRRWNPDGSTPALPPPALEESPLLECPGCRMEFLPLRAGQTTCGKPRCVRMKCAANALMCECGRGFKVHRSRGCAECEAESATFFDSESAQRQRLAAAAQREAQERAGMVAFARDWNQKHREYAVRFNSCEPLSEKAA